VIAIHSEILTRVTEENPLLLAPTDKIEPTIVFGRKYSVGFPSRSDWLDPGSVLQPNSVTFYTDGSLLDGRAGAGVYSESQNTGVAYSLGSERNLYNLYVFL
jgi:hypothetical protein